MSEIQVGDQSSKPQDLEKTEMVINAMIVDQVKKQMGSLSGLEKMVKGAGESDMPGMGGGGGSQSSFMSGGTSNEQGSTPSSLFAGDTAKKTRKKGSVSLSEFRSPTNSFTGAKRDKGEVMARKSVAESAFAGRMKKGCKKYSTHNAADLAEECQLLKKKWEWLPQGLVANKHMLPAFGFGHLLEAHNAVQAEKEKPAMAAIISGTANDMQKFQSLFKSGLDEGIKEQVYAGASTQFKQKLNSLMSQ